MKKFLLLIFLFCSFAFQTFAADYSKSTVTPNYTTNFHFVATSPINNISLGVPDTIRSVYYSGTLTQCIDSVNSFMNTDTLINISFINIYQSGNSSFLFSLGYDLTGTAAKQKQLFLVKGRTPKLYNVDLTDFLKTYAAKTIVNFTYYLPNNLATGVYLGLYTYTKN